MRNPSLELIDFSDKLQDLGRDADVPNLVRTDIHLYPFLSDSYPKARNIRLLEQANVPPPYILVGHSYSGDVARVYAGHFPDQIAGVILVEAPNEDNR